MRLSLSINGSHRFTASLSGAGYLNAHLNMHDRPKENDQSKKIRIVGTDTSNETENLSLSWPTIDLQLDDVVELRILPQGDGDPASEVRRSADAPSNLFSNVELAKELIHVVSDFEKQLMNFLSKSEAIEPTEESKKLSRAVGRVIYELGDSLLCPIYRRHTELMPDELKGELL